MKDGFIAFPRSERSASGVGYYVEPQPSCGVVGGWYTVSPHAIPAIISGEWFIARAPWNAALWAVGRLGDESGIGYPYPDNMQFDATGWAKARLEFIEVTGEYLSEQEPNV